MNDPYERRALLLHLGSALQTLSRILEYEGSDETIGELIAAQPLLSDVPLIEHVMERMTVRDLAAGLLHAFCLWPQQLLEVSLDYGALASSVRDHLFVGNPRGWAAYVATVRQDVPRFGEGLAPLNGSSALAERIRKLA